MALTMEQYDPPLFEKLNEEEYISTHGEDQEFVDAKAYLLSTSTVTGMNLYDHLTNMVVKVLEERPTNAVDAFEEISSELKRCKFTPAQDSIIEKVDPSTEVALAEIQTKLFTPGDDMIEEDPEEEEQSPLPNLMEHSYYFEQAGIGLNREEMVRIWLALKTLVRVHTFSSVRFWGKLFGIEQNYVVVEVMFAEGEDDEDEEQETTVESGSKIEEDDEEGNAMEGEEEITPKSAYKPPAVVEKEPKGTGVNKMTYFVCNEPGKPWTRLPSVTPVQIDVARKIKKFLTGRLDAPIVSYPPFPGNEANYLRAQIARISAGTQISPLGFYQFDEEAEEPEEGEIRESYIEAEEYEPMPVRELADPSLENWVHHTLHILPQGRTKWWNPKQSDEEAEEEESEEEKEEPEVIEPEVGPPLLTPISQDAELDELPAWRTHVSSKFVPKYAVAVVHSCLWPGAHAFAQGKTFDNIYIGWGHKYSAAPFNPMLPPPTQDEFPSGPEITETDDPSVEVEAAFKAAQAALLAEEEEEEEEEDAPSDMDEED